MLKAGRGQMKRHHDLEPVKPAPPKEASSEVPVVTNLPATTPSSSKVADNTVASNGWWNGWGWW